MKTIMITGPGAGERSGTGVERTGERAGWRTRLGELELLHRSRLRGRDLCNKSREWDGCDGRVRAAGSGTLAERAGARGRMANDAVAGERGGWRAGRERRPRQWRASEEGGERGRWGSPGPVVGRRSLPMVPAHWPPRGSMSTGQVAKRPDLAEGETRSALDMEGGQYTPGDPHRPREQPAPSEPTPNSWQERPTPSGPHRTSQHRTAGEWPAPSSRAPNSRRERPTPSGRRRVATSSGRRRVAGVEWPTASGRVVGQMSG